MSLITPRSDNTIIFPMYHELYSYIAFIYFALITEYMFFIIYRESIFATAVDQYKARFLITLCSSHTYTYGIEIHDYFLAFKAQ